MMGREGLPVSPDDAVEETIRMFLQHYGGRNRRVTVTR
jgi:hypothetical protein